MSETSDWTGKTNTLLVAAENGHQLHPSVLPAWRAMQKAMQADGIDGQLVSSFRNFDRQLAIWNRKWRGEAVLYDANGIELDFSMLSDNEKIDAILTWSALPGGSRHHWGTDIDIFDKRAVQKWNGNFELVDSEYCQNGPCYALAKWLDSYADDFGFFRPFLSYKGGVARELWHLSHRKTASQFEQQRSLESLKGALTTAEIEGRDAVLLRLEELYHRYVLNKGNEL